MDGRMKIDLHEKPAIEKGVRIKGVVGYEGYYSVTDDGRVWAHPRVFPRAGTSGQPIRGRGLRPASKESGHLTVALTVETRSKSHAVHLLVAEAFIGPRPEGHHTDHIDRNPKNNCRSNLRYVTPRINFHNNSSRGYCWDKDRGCYRAYLKVGWKLHYLGLHDNPEEARAAHVAAKKLHGVFTP
jgi:hypothetical protein